MKSNEKNNEENQEKNIIINSNVNNAVISVSAQKDDVVVNVFQRSANFDLSKLHPGDRFLDMDGNEYMCLGFEGETRSAIIVPTRNIGELEFGESSLYNGSVVDEYLTNSYADVVQYEFGPNCINSHTVDLTAVDTTRQQENVRRKVSLITYDMYKKYKNLLDDVLDGGFALATPWFDNINKDIACVIFDGRVRPRTCEQPHKIRPYFLLSTKYYYNIALTHVNGESTLEKREVIKNEN